MSSAVSHGFKEENFQKKMDICQMGNMTSSAFTAEADKTDTLFLSLFD